MIDIKYIRENLTSMAERLAKRGYRFDIETFKTIEAERKQLQLLQEQLQSERKKGAKRYSEIKAKNMDDESLRTEMSQVNEKLAIIDDQYESIQKRQQDFLLDIPNLPDLSVPNGQDETDNVEISRWSEPKKMDFTPLDHVALGEKLGLDIYKAGLLSGSRFAILKGPIARLHRALSQFMLYYHTTKHGYIEVNTPCLVKESILEGTGQLPKFKEDLFQLKDTDKKEGLYLIPTSEVTLTNLVREQIIEITDLPMQFTAHSMCFRSEAGSYGRDTKGLIRQHQFEKVELVQIVHPEDSWDALENMKRHAEIILQELELPYRVVNLCVGDLGFSAAKTYDIEVWLPGQQKYREISSLSNCLDFQARRMKARFRNPATQKVEYLHTLNGSGVAVGRALVAVLENHQDANGHIHIPKALQPFMDQQTVLS